MPESHETPNHPTQRKTAEDPWPDIKNHTTIQNICLSSQDEKKKTSIHTGITPTEKNTSTVPTHIIVVGPDDYKTMMAIGRIGADMRSAKDGIVLQRPSPINATNPRGPQQEGSRADRQGVHKTPRRPFSRGSLICIIIGHSGKPRHAHRTDCAPRPPLLKKTRTQWRTSCA